MSMNLYQRPPALRWVLWFWSELDITVEMSITWFMSGTQYCSKSQTTTNMYIIVHAYVRVICMYCVMHRFKSLSVLKSHSMHKMKCYLGVYEVLYIGKALICRNLHSPSYQIDICDTRILFCLFQWDLDAQGKQLSLILTHQSGI